MGENNYFAKNLRYLREVNGVEQMELASFLGRKSASTISEWESGKYTPRSGTLKEIANFFHVTLSDIVEKDLQEDYPQIHPVGETVRIPVLGKIACGDPITAEENVEEYRERQKERLPGGRLFYLKASGDSMSPTIPDGSFVLCKQQPDVESGEIAAVLINDDEEATLKKVRKVNGVVILEPLNDAYEPYVITDTRPARIIGKALEVVLKL